MNITNSNPQAKPRPTAYILIALAAIMVIYWVANIANIAHDQESLLSLPEQAQISLGDSDVPAAMPVPVPPALYNLAAATPVPSMVAQSNPVPVPQPVPTPPPAQIP